MIRALLDDKNEIDLRENNLLSLRVNLRLRRWCWSYYIVHCSFPISKFFFLIFTFIRTVNHFNFFRPSEALARENFPISKISRPRVVLYFLLSFKSSPASRAEVHCPFPISKCFGRAKLSLAKIFRFQICPGLACSIIFPSLSRALHAPSLSCIFLYGRGEFVPPRA